MLHKNDHVIRNIHYHYYQKQVPKLLWTRKGVRTTVLTAGHYTHAELTSGMLWLAVTAVACTPTVYAN